MRPILFLFLSIFIFAESAFCTDITFHGFVSGSYSYNFNTPDSGQNQLRVFDFDDNTFKIDVAEVVLEKTVPDSGNVGFRVDFVAGSSIPRIIASAGLFRDPDTGEAEDFDLEQAYVSVNASGIHLDFGKFITHTGAEVIEGYDGFNDNYTRSLLFGFAIPFTHTGLRASHAFNDRASAMVMIANGWDNVKDNNRGKTFGAQFLFVPAHGCTVYLNYIGGPEQNDSSNMRNLFDAVAVWKPLERVTFTFNYDYAKDNNAVGPGADATWNGFAAYGKVDLTDTFSMAFRGEQFKDEDGVRTGVIQKVREFTITPSVKIGKGFVARGDLRFDHSNKRVFQKNDSFKQNQTTIALNLLYFF
jgi:hypothetical protein